MNDDLTKAIAAVQANPNDPQAWLNLGRLLQVRGETNKAEHCFKQVKKLTATSSSPTLQQTARPTNDEMNKAKAAVQANPKEPEAWMKFSQLLQARGYMDQAGHCRRQAEALMSASPPISSTPLPSPSPVYPQEAARQKAAQAVRYFREGDLAQAQHLFEEALVLYPEFVDAHDGLGQCYLQSGQVERAVAQWEEGLHYDPNHVEMHRRLAQELYRQGQEMMRSGQVAKALPLLQQARTHYQILPVNQQGTQVAAQMEDMINAAQVLMMTSSPTGKISAVSSSASPPPITSHISEHSSPAKPMKSLSDPPGPVSDDIVLPSVKPSLSSFTPGVWRGERSGGATPPAPSAAPVKESQIPPYEAPLTQEEIPVDYSEPLEIFTPTQLLPNTRSDWTKIAIGGFLQMILLIPVTCLLFFPPGLILIFVLEIIPIGYGFLLAEQIIKTGRYFPLPEWSEWKGIIVKGSLTQLISFVYLGPLFSITMWLMSGGTKQPLSDQTLSRADQIIGTVILILIGTVLLVAWMASDVAICNYLRTGSLFAAFYPREIFGLFWRTAPLLILGYLFYLLSYVFVTAIGVLSCGIGIFGTVFVQSLLYKAIVARIYRFVYHRMHRRPILVEELR